MNLSNLDVVAAYRAELKMLRGALAAWPWALLIEGTPRMARFIEWAEKH